MAIKIKRKLTQREESKQPDQIYDVGQKFFEEIEKNKKQVGIGLAVAVVIVIAGSALVDSGSASTREDGAAILDAALVLNSPVIEEPGDEVDDFYFSEEERADAIIVALSDSIYDSDPEPAAALLAGSASTVLGDSEQAQQRYHSATAAGAGSSLTIVALQALAANQFESGDVVSAMLTLDLLAEETPAMRGFAALERARLTEANGDLEGALALYRSVGGVDPLDVLAEGAFDADIVANAQHRAAVLSVLIGPDQNEEPVMGVDEGTEDEPDEALEEAAIEETPEETPEEITVETPIETPVEGGE